MTDKEKKALKAAFDIPEPDRKQEFAELFRQRMGQKNKKRIPPVVMRITAAAAMLAVVAGVIANMPDSPSNLGKYDNVTVTTAVATASNTEKIPVTSATHENSDNLTTITTTAAPPVTGTAAATRTAAIVTRNTTATENATSPLTAKITSSGQSRTVTTTAKVKNTTASKTSTTSIISSSESKNNEKNLTTTNPLTALPITTTIMTTVNYIPYGRDLTVSPSITYTVGSNVVNYKDFLDKEDAIPPGTGNNSDNNIDNSPPYKQKIDELFDNSYAVVLAKINKIVYTSISGKPYTIENIIVTDSLKGTLRNYDMISLYLRGGYMPADEYAESHPYIHIDDTEGLTIYDDGGCSGEQYVGDTFLFFIKKGSSDMPKGAYTLTGKGDEAVFRYQNGCYVSISNDQNSFSANYFS